MVGAVLYILLMLALAYLAIRLLIEAYDKDNHDQ